MEQNLAQYQKILRKSPRLFQAAQQARIPPHDTVSVVSNWVLAPAVSGFVRWLMAEASKAGKQRLYFLARDGYLMYRAALILQKACGLPIECRYLSLSRYSLRIPAYHLDRCAALDYICRDGLHVTPNKILSRTGLTEEHAGEVLNRLPDFLRRYPDREIPRPELAEVRRHLSQCPVFWEYMDQHSRAAMPALAGYLAQEGLLDGMPDAIVDSGWVGSMQKALNRILAQLGRTKGLEGYYWGLYDLPVGVDAGNYHCYSFRPESDLTKKVYFNNNLFEAVFTAPHGMTLGYERSDGRYFPCYAPIDPRRKTLILNIQAQITAYLQRLMESPANVGSDPDPAAERKTILRLMKQLMHTPSIREAEIFGGLPFSDDVLENDMHQLAAPMSTRDIQKTGLWNSLMTRAGAGSPPSVKSAWMEGSIVGNGRHIKRYLKRYARFQYVRYIKKMYQYKRERRGEARG